jgi:ABC-2 type transport system ATP-binding protein
MIWVASTLPAIRTEGLAKCYGVVTALAGLDLEVAPGEVVGYLGPNGAGKTTTIRLLLSLIRPAAGRAEIFAIDCSASRSRPTDGWPPSPGEAPVAPPAARTHDQRPQS